MPNAKCRKRKEKCRARRLKTKENICKKPGQNILEIEGKSPKMGKKGLPGPIRDFLKSEKWILLQLHVFEAKKLGFCYSCTFLIQHGGR